ncbi:hypothetical protein F25303_11776 [Fusarium sp. NRRL 25303]|nr:hypothetical protein F25303_11776 [Fusarium sp. NRRL 25303]
MSSGYGSETDEVDVGSDDSYTPLSSLSSIIEDFQKPPEPYWLADIRFGHFVVPSCLSAEETTTREITSAIRGQEIDCPIIFVLSRHRQRTCSTEMLDLPFLPQYNEKTLEFEWFTSILEKNRAGEGPGNWKEVEDADQWERNTIRIRRVLTTSNLFGNNLSSELVSIRSSYPVVHSEMPIPRHVYAIPEYAVDNSHGNAMYNSIENRVLARDQDDAHAIPFVPPLTRKDVFPTITQSLSYNTLLLKHINDTGPIMKWRLTLQSTQGLQDNPATVIEVDAEHTIPSFLDGYSHAQVALCRRYMREIFDKDIKQVLPTEDEQVICWPKMR